MSMRDFLCELKLPAVLISVVAIVWCTALRSGAEQEQYYQPSEKAIRLRQEAAQRAELAQDDEATVRLELEP
ncbi:MAG TPA: hypothetical protein VGQ99_13095 [Tepidisphaeraceae bacterium]|jgi:hypothetical protein|nr:hypothetical protein [Tepidisphaeraceae bacterium]